MRKYYLIIFLTLFLAACKNEAPTQAETEIQTQVETETPTEAESTTPPPSVEKVVYAWVDQLRLRKSPYAGSDVIFKLKLNDSLIYAGEETMERFEVTLRGKKFNEPWIKVKTFSGLEGWIYGGGVVDTPPKRDLTPTPYDECYVLKNGQYTLNETCITQQASKVLRQDAAAVKSNRNGYTFVLIDGSLKQVVNSDSIRYEYIYYMRPAGYFVVRKSGIAGNDFLLISDKNGQEVAVTGFPKTAPNGKYILLYNTVGFPSDAGNRVQLYEYIDGELASVWARDLADWQIANAEWYSNTEVIITGQAMGSNLEKYKLLRLSDQWHWQAYDE